MISLILSVFMLMRKSYTIYSCLSSKFDRSDKIKLAAALEKCLQSVVNLGNKWFVIIKVSPEKKYTAFIFCLPPAWLMLDPRRATLYAFLASRLSRNWFGVIISNQLPHLLQGKLFHSVLPDFYFSSESVLYIDKSILVHTL